MRVMHQEQVALRKENQELSESLRKTVKERDETEQCFKEAALLNKEQLEQSTTSFDKLCEATRCLDEALVEIQTLRREKDQIDEEFNSLANTIGNVIDTASSKVENVVEDLKEKHRIEKDGLNKEIARLNQIIKHQGLSDNSKESEFQQKIASMEHINAALTENLQSALHTIVRSSIFVIK